MGKVLIIAEAGVNHNGSIDLAKRLIDVAAIAGADFVKFQSFKTEKLVSRSTPKAEYQKRNNTEDHLQFSMLKKLELTVDQHFELIGYCNEKRIRFLSTAFDDDSIDFLASLKLGLWKIPSGEVNNYLYLKRVALLREPVILSTGMCDMEDIGRALQVLLYFGLTKDQVTILHCNTEYPTPMEDVNLKAMQTIASEFGVKIGYSDHTSGIEISIAAVAMGASVIEKHFTMDRSLPGPDHKASLEPDELEAMIKAIRNVETAISGSGFKKPSPSERKNMDIARKSIVASRPIKKGELYTEENITVKRPGNGISPMQWESVLGREANRSFEEDELIEL